MTLTLELPPDLEKSLKEAAAKAGEQPTDFVIEAVQERLSKTAQPTQKIFQSENLSYLLPSIKVLLRFIGNITLN
jgi:uncharacterized protein (DUF1778 family)